MNTFNNAVKIVGSQAKLARTLGVSVGAVSQVANGRRPVPPAWCPIIEELTKRAVLCEELRPDVKWSVLRTGVAR